MTNIALQSVIVALLALLVWCNTPWPREATWAVLLLGATIIAVEMLPVESIVAALWITTL